jgi:hypothetical protein
MKNPLSQELMVACEIYSLGLRNEKVWLSKLQTNLSGKVGKTKIGTCINTLFDWGILKAEYGPTDSGRAGRLLFISDDSKPLIKELYEKYWVIQPAQEGLPK